MKESDRVKVYDRYRFAKSLRATIEEFSDSNDGVRVKLLDSNNAQYPVGADVWVHRQQLRRIESPELTEQRKLKQLMVIFDPEIGNGKWRYIVKSSNGIVLLKSKGYSNRDGTEKGLKSLVTALGGTMTKYYVQYKNDLFREPKEKDL